MTRRWTLQRLWRWFRCIDDELPYHANSPDCGKNVKVAMQTAQRLRKLDLEDNLAVISSDAELRGPTRAGSHYRAIHREMQRLGFRWTNHRYARSARYWLLLGVPQLLLAACFAAWAVSLVRQSDEGWNAAIATAIAVFSFVRSAMAAPTRN